MKVLKVIQGCILISLHKTGNFDKFILEYLTTPQSIIFSIRGNSDEHLFSPYNTFT